MERINLTQDRDKWQAVTNIVINYFFSQNVSTGIRSQDLPASSQSLRYSAHIVADSTVKVHKQVI